MNAIHPLSPAPANRRNAAPVDLAGLFRSSIHARIEADPHILFPSPYTRYTAAALLRLATLAAELERPEFIKEPRFRDWPLPPRNPRPKEPYFKFIPYGYRPRRRFPRNSPVFPPSDNRVLHPLPLAGNTPHLAYHFISAIKNRIRGSSDPALYSGPNAAMSRSDLYWRLWRMRDELAPWKQHRPPTNSPTPAPAHNRAAGHEPDDAHRDPIDDDDDFEEVLKAYESEGNSF